MEALAGELPGRILGGMRRELLKDFEEKTFLKKSLEDFLNKFLEELPTIRSEKFPEKPFEEFLPKF